MRRIFSNLFPAGILLFCFAVQAANRPPVIPKSAGKKILSVSWSKALKTGRSKKRYFPEAASPIVSGDSIFVGTHSSIFYALSTAKKGKIIWQFASGGPIASKPKIDGEYVFFGNNKGTVYALSAKTGKKEWEFFAGGEILAQPAILGDNLYIVTTSREVYSLNKKTGAENWSVFVRGFEKKITMRGNSQVVISGNRLYTGFADGQVSALSSVDGSVLWSKNLSEKNTVFEDVDSNVLVEDSHLYVAGYFGKVAKLAKDSGKVVWQKEVKSGANIASDGKNIYVSSADGAVVAFDKQTGVRRWEVPLFSGILSPPILVGSLLIVGSEQKSAYIISAEKGEVLQKKSLDSGFVNDAVASDSTLYFLSSSGKLTSLIIKLL